MNAPTAGRVVVVDDEANLREILSSTLQEAGYEPATAASGREALALIRASEFDLVLSDIVMPDMDGLELLRELRNEDVDVPLVLLTGIPTFQSAVTAVEHGALRYLVKPVGRDELIETVDRAVRLHRLARVQRQALALAEGQDATSDADLEAPFARVLSSFWMAYQPIVHAVDGTLVAHEALFRADEPTLPHPNDVFEAAERLGRVHVLGRAVRRSVAATLASGTLPGLAFVNLHPSDLVDEDLFSSTAPLSLAASRVVLEVTERASLDDIADLAARLRSLRALGYRIALDDLGAGYASLNSFARIEPDIVKIDMALVRDIDHEPLKARLVASMTALCQTLKTGVVAEGVETEAERTTLVSLGCDFLQGYLLGRPARLVG